MHPHKRAGARRGLVALTGIALLGGTLTAVPAAFAAPVDPAQLPPQEPGVTMRTYQLGSGIPQLCELRDGQTPNVDRLVPTIDLTSDEDFGAQDNFVTHALANLTVPTTGDYTFRLTSDDGSRLSIGGDLVVDNDGLHGEEAVEGTVTLEAGVHELKAEMFEATNGQRLLLEWRAPGATAFTVVPSSALSTEAGVVRVTAPGFKYCETGRDTAGDGLRLDAVNPGYDLVDLRPEGFEPMVSAMTFLGDDLVVVTSGAVSPAGPPEDPTPGEVFLLEGVTDADGPEDVTATKIATGLLNPMGVDVVDGNLWVSERDGLTELTPDADGDGMLENRRHADWPYGGTFHEFAFGLLHDEENFYVSLSVAIDNGGATTNPQPADGRGTTYAVDRETGEISAVAGGLRTPNGMGWGPDDELFVMDNQGAWLPASKMVQVEQDRFFNHYTNPAGAFEDQPVTPPVLWLPQNEIANSPSNPVLLEEGPFADQMLFGDVTYGGLQRAYLDEVEGQKQGVAFRHTAGLEAGVNRTLVGPDGSLYVGGIGEAGNWSESGKLRYGLQKLVPNGESVFDMTSVEITEAGFDVTYTEPLSDATVAGIADAYELQQWRYVPTQQYGGPKVDETTLPVTAATVSEDRRTVSLAVDGREPGHVVHLRSPRSFTAEDGEELWSTEAWYTANVVPGYVAPPDLGWYEAEEAVLRGGAAVDSEHNGYSGTGFAGGFWNVGASVTFTATVDEAGVQPVHLRYANGPNPAPGTKEVSVLVNGTEVDPWALPSTGPWNRWAFATRDLDLRAGANEITVRYDADDDGNVNLDLLSVGEQDVCAPVAEEGWTGLFDGTLASFSEWNMAGPGSFGRQADCSIRGSGGLGLLWHPEQQENYALHLDWKLTKDDNGGVFVGFPDPGNDPWVGVNQGYEIQIDATDADDRTTGAIYTFQGADLAAVAEALEPVGQWNSYEIQVSGDTIKVFLNDVLVNDFTSTDPARDIERGFLGVQNHGAGEFVYYRDIRVKQLEETGPTAPAAPAGVSATGADSALRVSWDAVEGATGYTATASPGGRTCTTTDATTCRIGKLSAGTPYTVTVVAEGPGGTSQASAPSASVTPSAVPATPGVTSLAVSAETRCSTGGKAVLVVRARNKEAVPADVLITTSLGEVKVTALAPGTTHTARLTGRTSELAAGEVTVAGYTVRAGAGARTAYRAAHPGSPC